MKSIKRICSTPFMVSILLIQLIAGSNFNKCWANDDTEEKLKALRSLGYLSGTPVAPQDAGKLGVVRNEPEAQTGLTVICTERNGVIDLIDMKGAVVHSIDLTKKLRCKLLERYDRNHFLVLGDEKSETRGLFKIDFNGKIIWSLEQGSFHHDLDVAENGDIIALAKKVYKVNFQGSSVPIFDDTIVVLSGTGKLKLEIPLYNLFSKFVPEKMMLDLVALEKSGEEIVFDSGAATDILHSNSLEILKRDSIIGPKGAILLSFRNLNLIAVFDLKKRRVIWTWGPGVLDMPHNPSILPNGNLLIFDNGSLRGWTRIVELDPKTRNLTWEYRSLDPLFYSQTRGSAQLLPNGNIFAAESDRGRLFEVTREGKLVWEYWAPESKGADGYWLRETIYRSIRLTKDSFDNPDFKALWKQVYGVN